MTEQRSNRPVKDFRSGGVAVSLWRNETEQNGRTVVTHSATISKRYRDKDGIWQDSSSFFLSDLPRLELVVRKAYEHLALRETEEAEDAQA